MSAASPSRLKHAEFRGRIGMARTTVTPPVGVYSRTWGSAQHDVAEGVHRPALASCLVFQSLSGDNELVFTVTGGTGTLGLGDVLLWTRVNV